MALQGHWPTLSGRWAFTRKWFFFFLVSSLVLILFFPHALPSLPSVIIGRTLLVTIFPWQIYRIYRAGRPSGKYLPKETRLLPLCLLLVMITPLCDLVLGRDYPLEGVVLIAALAIATNCLYLIEVYLRYPTLQEDTRPTSDASSPP